MVSSAKGRVKVGGSRFVLLVPSKADIEDRSVRGSADVGLSDISSPCFILREVALDLLRGLLRDSAASSALTRTVLDDSSVSEDTGGDLDFEGVCGDPFITQDSTSLNELRLESEGFRAPCMSG